MMAVHTESSPCKLFDKCIYEVLQTPTLSEKAAIHLPPKVCYHILHRACQSKNFSTIEKIVAAWSHPTLSFNFMSYPLQSGPSTRCVLAPEYDNVYSGDHLSPSCVTSVAVGVFNHVYRQQVRQGGQCGIVQIQEVDISHLHVSLDDGE